MARGDDGAVRYEVEVVDLQKQHTAVVHKKVSPDKIAEAVGTAFGAVAATLAAQGLAPEGPPFARYRMTGAGDWDVEAGFPAREPVAADGGVVASTLPGGRAARTVHTGDYAELAAAYDAIKGWVVDNGYVPDGEPWECYLDEPDVPQPRTEVFLPCHDTRRP